MLAMAATPLAARADITSRMTSSVQLTVNAAATQMQRVETLIASLEITWTQLMEPLLIQLVLVLK